jgi:hypothetical protein
MKNPDEYTKGIVADDTIKERIKQAQKDAYNEAIRDAIENATASIENELSLNTDLDYDDYIAVVNHESIFKLMKK